MGEWDQNRPDILGRKIESNIPPAVWVPTKGQAILIALVLGVPAMIAAMLILSGHR